MGVSAVVNCGQRLGSGGVGYLPQLGLYGYFAEEKEDWQRAARC